MFFQFGIPDYSSQNAVPLNQKQLSKNNTYNIHADIQINQNTVTIKESIFFSKSATKMVVYLPSANTSKTNILSINTDTAYTQKALTDTTVEITFNKAQKSLEIQYEILLDEQKKPLSYSENLILLTDFLITPAVYKSGKPMLTYKYAFGDPYLYSVNNYSIQFNVDKEWAILAPGKVDDNETGTKRVAHFQIKNIRSFPAVLYKKANVMTEKYGNTTVTYLNAFASHEYVNKSLAYGEKNIGPYPYNEFFVIKAPLSNRGMEFSNMIFLSDICFDNAIDLEKVTYHEVFHQWFYGIIGTDQLNEPFLDEGIANYLTLLLRNDPVLDTYSPKLTQMRLSDYSSLQEYYDLSYNQSTQYICSLHKKTGDSFLKILKKIYSDKKYSILYYKDFTNYFNSK